MSQDYNHACERAELLGLPIPSEEEWKETQRAEAERRANDEEDNAVIQNLDAADETAQRMSGGLDEINSILNVTQKKINRFKIACGSLSTLLKVRVGSRNHTPDHKPVAQNCSDSKDVQQETPAEEEQIVVEVSGGSTDIKSTEGNPVTPRKLDISGKMGSHLDKLDSLITKAENAQYSMQHQTKQMRKFLK